MAGLFLFQRELADKLMAFDPKFTADTIAGIITALGTLGIAAGAWIQLPLVGKQVKELATQIDLSIQAEKAAEKRAREWETMKICQKYHFDPVIESACQRIWNASDGGKNYHDPKVDSRDAICILNYLDGIAVGINQKLYIEKIVEEHLGNIFQHHVERFLNAGIVPKEGYSALIGIYAKWFTPTVATSYDATKQVYG